MSKLPSAPSRTRVIAILAVIIHAVVLSACSPSSTTAQLPQEVTIRDDGFAGQPLEEPLPRPHTSLRDTNGDPFDLAEATAGKPVLVFMGYTSCPDICPVHMSAIARAMDEVALVAGRDLDVVFITVDPARDDPETLAHYLDAFNRDFIGVTGSREEIDATADALGLPHATFEEPDERGFYLVGHPGQVIAFSPDGPARVVYPFGVRASHWVHDLPLLIEGRY